MAADVQAQMPREKAGDALHVKRAIREVSAGVRSALHDPDLAWSSICVVKAAAVIDGGDLIGPAVDEEQRPRLE